MNLILFIAALGLVALYVVYLDCKRQLVDMERYERLANRFFDKADALVSDDETPDEVLALLDSASKSIRDKSVVSILLDIWINEVPSHPRRRFPTPTMAEFFARRPELERAFLEAMGAAMIAVSYLDYWRGRRLRAIWTAVDTERRQEELATVAYQDDRLAKRYPEMALAA
jgi:hypothetical protein